MAIPAEAFIEVPFRALPPGHLCYLRGIWMFTKFDTVWLWGEGAGAGREIRTLPIYTYMRTFTYYQAGYGAALSVVMFLMLMAATAVYFRLFWREEEMA